MASVSICRSWPDGDQLAVSIEVEASFPDVIAEARQAAVRAFEDAMEVTLAADPDDED